MAEPKYAVTRSNPRFLFSAEAEAILRDGRPVAAQVFELSLRGCFIDAVEEIPVGTRFELQINNGAEILELPSRVIYTDTSVGLGVFGLGVVFENVPPEQNIVIERRLRELAIEQAEPKPTLESA
jgi:hypothetical protein